VRLGLGLTGGVVVVLGLAQIFLPKLAASRISSRVGKYGEVESVHVSAWPAVKLLWGDADSVKVTAAHLSLSPSQTGKLLEEAHDVANLDLTASSAREGPLSVSDVSLHKRGKALTAQASVDTSAVTAALPEGFGVQLVSSSDGRVEVRASGGLFGFDATVDAVAEASDGKLIVHPRGLLIENLKLTLFSDPHVYVEGVGARAVDDGSGGTSGYVLSIGASLR
jgi:hypothetical protein